MSQWGKSRTFVKDGVTLHIQAHAATDGFDPASPQSTVDDLILMGSGYDGSGTLMVEDAIAAGEAAHAMFEKIKAQYVGRPYSEWLSAHNTIEEEETYRGPVWEYATQNLRRSYSAEHDRSYEQEVLARLGVGGWELAAVVLDKRGDHIGYFKRRAIKKVRM